MRKTLLLLMVSLFAIATWAADVSIVETYATNPYTSAQSARTSFNGRYTEWFFRNARSGGDNDKLKDGTKGFWLSRTSGTSCYLESTLEGGIKNVAFNWRQFSTGDNGFNYILNINTKIGSAASVTQQSFTWTGDADHANNDQIYSQTVAIKANNVKLTIQNSSTKSDGATAGGRLIVGPITITPYLLYTDKEVNVVLGQTGYINDQLINNTDEGAVSYSSDATGVAQVNSETGEITPVSVGDAIITASWEGVTTTYTVHVISGVVETFANVSQTSSSGTKGSNWNTPAADICNWETKFARRGGNDKMNGKQYSWLTLDGTTRGYIKTTNLEGGIKDVSFKYGQFGAEAGLLLRWKVSAIGTTTASDVIERDGDLGENRSYSRGAMYTHSFNCAENAQLEIMNMSINDDETQPSNNARILIGDIYITPYLLYATKEYTLDTRVTTTYTNADLINNTGEAPVFSVSPTESGVTIDAATGEVTAADDTQADFTVTATWGAVTTTYVLHVTSRTVTEASYPEPNILEIGLNGTINKELEYTAGYDGTIAYASSNEKVAAFESGVLTIKGVGQTTITATLPQTDNYKAASASYVLQITDNSADVQVEAFSAVPQGNAAAHAGQPWDGDVYDWKVSDCGGVRKNGDKFASDQEHEGIWMGTPDDNSNYSSLTVEGGAEGGIKHIWFFCEQPYNTGETGYTLKPVVYLNEATAANKVGEVEIVGASGATSIAANRTLFGASNVAKSNSVLIIRNESYLTDGGARPAANRGRILLDEIHITPYLLYTTKERTLDLRIANTCTYAPEINNTESGGITYSLEDNDEEATIDPANGEVTGIKAGQVTVKATWSEGAYTTYTLNIIAATETEASYPSAAIHATMGEAIPANILEYTDGYDGTIAYASSVPAVADFENGVLTLKAPGQTKITATLPATSNYTEASASYILTVSYSNYEAFEASTTDGWYVKPEQERMGDVCKWYAYVGGIQTPEHFSSNAITTRAPRSEEPQGYVKSAKLSGGISALAFNYSMMFADNDIDKWDIHIYVNDRLVGQLTNEEGGDLEGINGRTLSPMRTKVITGIDEPGQFVIRFENHSTVKSTVEYTSGNKGRFAIDNVSWENFAGAIVLSESTDNSSVIAANNGSTQDVQIARSALVANVWNTLCLPFAISKANDLEGAEVQEMTSAELNGDELTVGFSAVTDDELVAGKPYLVKPASALEISGTYNDKLITSTAASVNYSIITMHGIFSPYAMTAGDKTTLFVGTPNSNGDNLFYPSTNGNLKGFRAYFKLDFGQGQAPKRARFVVDQTEIVTGMEQTESETLKAEKVIRDGQLFIIREGKMYNAQGQIIR